MTLRLAESVAILSRTPAVLRSLLWGLPDDWVAERAEGEGTFSAFDVVGHLVHGESTDWIPRVRRLLEHGTARAFEPFDRFAQWQRDEGRRLDELLDEFEHLRRDNVAALSALVPGKADLARRGLHPALGEVTLGELLATWVVHDLDHLAQIARVLARRPGAHVGPWKAYLPVLAPRPAPR